MIFESLAALTVFDAAKVQNLFEIRKYIWGKMKKFEKKVSCFKKL